MKRRLFSFLFIALVVMLSAPMTSRSADPHYLGQKFCRACHNISDDNRYHLWLNSKHAKAYEALEGAEKANPECLGCHTTGYGEVISDKATRKDLRGVQCEACHGPGSQYKSMKVMKDPKLAREAGLWEVTREICLRCHR
jgi:nitrate/TMAO reductase-like tetraheme cytochrome c subunit